MVMMVVVFLFGLFFKQISEFIRGGRLVEGINKGECIEDEQCGYNYCPSDGSPCDGWDPSSECTCETVVIERWADWVNDPYNYCKGHSSAGDICVGENSS